MGAAPRRHLSFLEGIYENPTATVPVQWEFGRIPIIPALAECGRARFTRAVAPTHRQVASNQSSPGMEMDLISALRKCIPSAGSRVSCERSIPAAIRHGGEHVGY
jgi:hypothetical protein